MAHDTHATPHTHDGGHSGHGHDSRSHDSGAVHVHVVPVSLLALIFIILMALTVLTYAVTMVDFGYQVNLLVAIAIAVIKGGLVCLYFMHLRWDEPFNSLALIGALLFVGLFIVIASLDSGQYHNLRAAYADASITTK